MNFTVSLLTFIVAATLSATTTFAQRSDRDERGQEELTVGHPMNPSFASNGGRASRGSAPTAGSTGAILPPITYHGGQVMTTPTVYLIWYGNWAQTNGTDNAIGQTIVRDFLYGVSNSGHFKINTSYGAPTGLVNVGPEYTDNYSLGSTLSDANVRTIVSNTIYGGKLPRDSNGIYFVLTSSDVAESSGFCTNYCGWHTAGRIAGSTLKYSFIGNSARCLSGCAAQATGPNGNAGIDGMLSVLAHELEETVSDPLPTSGWADSQGGENADKCAWTFGSNSQTAPNGAFYNMTLPAKSQPTRNYLIQRNLDANSVCYVDYITKTQ